MVICFLAILIFIFEDFCPVIADLNTTFCTEDQILCQNSGKIRGQKAVCFKDKDGHKCNCLELWEAKKITELQFICTQESTGDIQPLECQDDEDCPQIGEVTYCQNIFQCFCLPPDENSINGIRTKRRQYRPEITIGVCIHMQVPAENKSSGAAIVPVKKVVTPGPHGEQFTIQHVWLLMGFVLLPMVCWCGLYAYSEGYCRGGRRIRRRNADNLVVMCLREELQSLRPNRRNTDNPETAETETETRLTATTVTSDRLQERVGLLGRPPAYEEAVENAPETTPTTDPPPSYDDVISEVRHTVFVVRD